MNSKKVWSIAAIVLVCTTFAWGATKIIHAIIDQSTITNSSLSNVTVAGGSTWTGGSINSPLITGGSITGVNIFSNLGITGTPFSGGTIDLAAIGSTTPSTANFTTLKLNGAAPSGHALVGNGTSYVDTAITVAGSLSCTGSPQTCSRSYTDGSYEIQGPSTAVSGTPNSQVLTITYPVTFTTAPDLTVSPIAAPAGGGSPCTGFSCPVMCSVVRGSQTTTGASVAISWATVGGSGYASLSAGDYCEYHVVGK
jgi:hypothetical protein